MSQYVERLLKDFTFSCRSIYGKGGNIMTYVWTWKGKFFGYISNGHLYTKKGKCVGVLRDNHIYNRQGKYIGEVKNDNRLITCKSKKSWRGPSAPNSIGSSCGSYANYAGYAMYAGYEDFPGYESF